MIQIPKLTRSLAILLIGQAVAGSTGPVLFLISGLMGPTLAPTLALSTLPMSLVVVGIALSSPVASLVMARLGRKWGHLMGLSITFVGAGTAGMGLSQNLFALYCLGCALCGMGGAFNNQIRFTAAEGAGEQKALVHSWVMMFSLFAALLGPTVAEKGRDLLTFGAFTGSIALLMALLAVLIVLFLLLPADRPSRTSRHAEPTTRISRWHVMSEGRFWMAALSGITSFATMTLLMSATPLQMHQVEHFTDAQTTSTIRSHIVAMFLPSLFSGFLLARFGIRRLVLSGIALFALCIAVAYQSVHFHHYWWALVLLGVGWNFLFLASSTWVSQSYSGPERFVAQGANDLLVFGIQSVASLGAGGLLFALGWKGLVLLPVPLLVGLAVFVFRGARS